MAFHNTPSLYYSPQSSRGTSGDENSTDLVSPMPDLTEAVTTLTDGYAPFAQPVTDNPWPSNSFYGYPHAQHPGGHGYEVDVKPSKPSNISDVNGNLSIGPSSTFGFGGDQTHVNYEQPQGNVNPFASMSTAMLHNYLSRADPFNAPFTSNLQDHTASGQTQATSTSAPTQALFRQVSEGAEADSAEVDVQRSPSPLLEVKDDDLMPLSATSPEDLGESEPIVRPRRASEGGEPLRSTATKDRTRRMSALLPMEEKLLRAQATEGLSKPDKRRVQNKLAQRAFRARSKVANRNAHGRLEHLEELTEQQAARIVKMNDLIGRLQRENTGLKAVKFQQAMDGIAAA